MRMSAWRGGLRKPVFIAETGWKITLANTGEHTLKGGRLKRVEKYIHGNHFMLTYGEGVTNVDIQSLLDFHQSHGKLAAVTGVNPLSRFGELHVDGHFVKSFQEKPQVMDGGLINGGFFLFFIAKYLTTSHLKKIVIWNTARWRPFRNRDSLWFMSIAVFGTVWIRLGIPKG